MFKKFLIALLFFPVTLRHFYILNIHDFIHPYVFLDTYFHLTCKEYQRGLKETHGPISLMDLVSTEFPISSRQENFSHFEIKLSFTLYAYCSCIGYNYGIGLSKILDVIYCNTFIYYSTILIFFIILEIF